MLDLHVFKQSYLTLSLEEVDLRDLVLLHEVPCPIYLLSTQEQTFKKALVQGSRITKEAVKELLQESKNFYIHHDDRATLIKAFENMLLKTTRALSMGSPEENCIKLSHLMCVTLKHLYKDPINDSLLKAQYQCATILASHLASNLKIHKSIYREITKRKYYYLYVQPYLSSLFTLGALKYSQSYSEQEIINLFCASYFKDVGMSTLPDYLHNQEVLSPEEISLIAEHTKKSVDILKGRITLKPSHLTLIENHHLISLIQSDQESSFESNPELLVGSETMIVILMDIIAAMISERPYRQAIKLFNSLETVKGLLANDYAREFKMIVNYFRKYYK